MLRQCGAIFMQPFNMKNEGKILVICLGSRGGLIDYTKNIVEYLDKDKYDIIVFKKSGFNAYHNVIEIYNYSNKFNFLLLSLFYIPWILMKLTFSINQYKVLYIPGPFLWNLPFVSLFKLFRRPIVLTVHDDILHEGQKTILEQWLIDRTIKKCKNFIFLTNYVFQSTIKRFDNIENHCIIPHGIFPVKNLQISIRRRKKRILFLGRIVKYKGVELLNEAFNKLDSSYELTLAGLSNYKLNIIDKNNNIKFENKFLSEEELSYWLDWCDIIVLPYLEATQSGVVTLGIFAEKPMICTNVGGLVEQLESNEAIFIRPNANELYDALVKLSSDDDLYQNIHEALKVKKRNLKWDKIAFAINNFIIEISSSQNC
jgi:glycosyltransferase involved in cell wall biosynthesis